MNEMGKQAQEALEKQAVENVNSVDSGIEASPVESNGSIPDHLPGMDTSIPENHSDVAASNVDVPNSNQVPDIEISHNAADNGLVENEQKSDTSIPESDSSVTDAEKGSRSTRGEDDAAAVAEFERASYSQGMDNSDFDSGFSDWPSDNTEGSSSDEFAYKEDGREEYSGHVENIPAEVNNDSESNDSVSTGDALPSELESKTDNAGSDGSAMVGSDTAAEKTDSTAAVETSHTPEEAVKPDTDQTEAGLNSDATDNSIPDENLSVNDFSSDSFENVSNFPENSLNDFDSLSSDIADKIDQTPDTNPSDTGAVTIDDTVYDRTANDNTDSGSNSSDNVSDIEANNASSYEPAINTTNNEDIADKNSQSDTEKNANENVLQASEGSGTSDSSSSESGEQNQRASESEPNDHSGQIAANDTVDQGVVKDDGSLNSAQSDLSAEVTTVSDTDAIEGEVGQTSADSDVEDKGNGSSLADTVSASVVDMIQGINDSSLEDNFDKLTNMFEGTDDPCTTEGYSDIVGETLDDCKDLLDSTDDTVSLSPDAYENAIDQWNDFNTDNDLVDIDNNDFDFNNNNDVEIENNDDVDDDRSDPIGIEDLTDDYL